MRTNYNNSQRVKELNIKIKAAPYTVTILLFILSFSCKKDTIIINPVKDIAGTWEWIYTYFPYPSSDSNPLTPQYTGIQEIIIET